MFRIGLIMLALAVAGPGRSDEPAYKHKTKRPLIWVDSDEKAMILKKIETHAWATSVYTQIKAAADKDIAEYTKDVDGYLRELPLDWKTAGKGMHPQFRHIKSSADEKAVRYPLMRLLQSGIESGIVYYLTGDETYGQYSADILYAVIEALALMDFNKKGRGGNAGYIFVSDHLKEARVFGAQIPILYDFTKPFLDKGGKPYSLVTKGKVDFNVANAQKVFENYVYLALNRGHKGSNWSVLEGSSLIHNTLALEDLDQRKKYLKTIVDKGTRCQDSIRETARFFDQKSGMWPESTQYAGGVASGLSYHMAVLTRYNPSWTLAEKYPWVPMSFARIARLKYPNNEIIFYGDGLRKGGYSLAHAELGYFIGVKQGLGVAQEKYGNRIVTALKNETYDRGRYSGKVFGASAWKGPVKLFWNVPTVQGNVEEKKSPYRTDDLPFAGMYLQRNLSAGKDPADGLMCFVGGAGFVHGHASGMNMELYGGGAVLGVKSGKGKYRSEIHNNYYRIFAGHNTVIVNGESRGEGGWAGLKINTVQLVTMEPMPRKPAVSEKHSFTLTSFRDDRGDKAEAEQRRLMAIVRTSPTSGYYVDVYRSKSKLPKQFHDYLYHGLADQIVVENTDITFADTPERFMASSKKPWKNNRIAQNPGWHYFTNVKTARYQKDLSLLLPAGKLAKPAAMRMFVGGETDREISTVLAPESKFVPKPYEKKTAPTVVIRQTGEAWDRPFAVVYEPTKNAAGKGAIRSVKTLTTEDGTFCGFDVISSIDNKVLKQLVLIPNGKPMNLEALNLSFDGTYAVVSLLENTIDTIYIGHGKRLTYGNHEVAFDTPGSVAITFTDGKPSISAKGSGTLTVNGKPVNFGK